MSLLCSGPSKGFISHTLKLKLLQRPVSPNISGPSYLSDLNSNISHLCSPCFSQPGLVDVSRKFQAPISGFFVFDIPSSWKTFCSFWYLYVLLLHFLQVFILKLISVKASLTTTSTTTTPSMIFITLLCFIFSPYHLLLSNMLYCGLTYFVHRLLLPTTR